LPPESAPLKDKLAAAMARSEKYNSQRALAQALGTDGSLVGKWLNGNVNRINHLGHRRRLAILLDTPKNYFTAIPKGDLIQQLEAEVADLATALEAAKLANQEMKRRVARLDLSPDQPLPWCSRRSQRRNKRGSCSSLAASTWPASAAS
jgi:transcriptional regulator with XRE-family HTH domain